MNKKYILTFIAISILFSCNKNNSNVKYIDLEGEIISDNIYTRMPGRFFLTNQHLIWTDPFSAEKYIHFIDRSTKKEVSSIGTKGQGPNEFSTPAFSLAYDDNLYIFDLNTGKQAVLNTDSAVVGQEQYVFLEKSEQKMITDKIMVDTNEFFVLTPNSKENLFKLINEDKDSPFGEPFINHSFENQYDIYQGKIEFNFERDKFVYTNYIFPYLAIYNYDNECNSLSLAAETNGPFKYEISDNKLHYEKTKKGSMGLALSKDFIILQKRDYNTDKVNEEKLTFDQFDKLPKTVFLYDYAGNLQYIVNLKVPTLRICAETKSNILYTIGLDSEFVIMKYDLGAIN